MLDLSFNKKMNWPPPAAQRWIQARRRPERGLFLLLPERLFIRFEADHSVLHPSPRQAQLDARGLISLLSGALKNIQRSADGEKSHNFSHNLKTKMRKMKEMEGKTERALKSLSFTTLK